MGFSVVKSALISEFFGTSGVGIKPGMEAGDFAVKGRIFIDAGFEGFFHSSILGCVDPADGCLRLVSAEVDGGFLLVGKDFIAVEASPR